MLLDPRKVVCGLPPSIFSYSNTNVDLRQKNRFNSVRQVISLCQFEKKRKSFEQEFVNWVLIRTEKNTGLPKGDAPINLKVNQWRG